MISTSEGLSSKRAIRLAASPSTLPSDLHEESVPGSLCTCKLYGTLLKPLKAFPFSLATSCNPMVSRNAVTKQISTEDTRREWNKSEPGANTHFCECCESLAPLAIHHDLGALEPLTILPHFIQIPFLLEHVVYDISSNEKSWTAKLQ